MWSFIYNAVGIPLLWIGIHAMALVSRKVRRALRGRKGLLDALSKRLESLQGSPRLWVHASSMGEFEQAKPIIERLKAINPDIVIIASFFSPSGYANNIRYPFVDAVTYIPFDSLSRARAFLDVLKPDAATFIRYDVWPNHLWECNRHGIPSLLTNATLRSNSPRLWPVSRTFHRNVFQTLRAILTISEADAERFRRFGLEQMDIRAIGDTRYDRVQLRAMQARSTPLLPESMTGGKKILVAGSSWSEDEEVLIPVLQKLFQHEPDLLCIIVPHEPTVASIEALEYKMNGISSIRFSHVSRYDHERVILVDSIGILLQLYASAHVAFVGGGFRSNVHNTLEPAAYGIPVVYGPKISNSQEAAELAESGGGFVVHNRRELYRTLRFLFANDEQRREEGQASEAFVTARTGATARIVQEILRHLPKKST